VEELLNRAAQMSCISTPTITTINNKYECTMDQELKKTEVVAGKDQLWLMISITRFRNRVPGCNYPGYPDPLSTFK